MEILEIHWDGQEHEIDGLDSMEHESEHRSMYRARGIFDVICLIYVYLPNLYSERGEHRWVWENINRSSSKYMGIINYFKFSGVLISRCTLNIAISISQLLLSNIWTAVAMIDDKKAGGGRRVARVSGSQPVRFGRLGDGNVFT